MAKMKVRVGRPRKSPTKVRQGRETEYRLLLEWFLKFVNEPISENMTRGDLYNLFDYLRSFMLERLAFVREELPPFSLDFVRESQECCRNIFKAILQKRDSIKEDSQFDLISFSNLLPPEEMEEIDKFPMDFSIVIQSPDTIYKIPSLEIPKTLTRKSVYNLIIATADLLSQFYLSRFKTCKKPDCARYFYQKTEKPMDYCSLQCSNWGKYRKYNKKRGRNKNPQVKVQCHKCGYQKNLGPLEDIIKNESLDMKYCPKCKEIALQHVELYRQGGKWTEGQPIPAFEWEIQKEKVRKGD